MNLSIITINYNSSENTIKLLESLKTQTDSDFRIIVVDNNSDPGQKLLLKNRIAEIGNLTFIESSENLGFSGGNNAGIRRALQEETEWVVLLNNDTIVEESFIEKLKIALENKIGVAGIAMNEGGQISYAGKIAWLKPTLSHIHQNPGDVNHYIIGGGLAIQREVLDNVGLLDENYFLYFEDADWTLRVRQAGYPITFLTDLSIQHSVSASTKKLGSPMLLRYHYRNALYFNRKNGPWYIKALTFPWSWIIAIKQIVKIMLGKNREDSLAILKGVIDWYAGRMGKIKN